MNKKLMDKIKEGVSVEEVETFARKYSTEVFAVLAVLIGAISSGMDFFTGPKIAIFFALIGMGLGVFFPVVIERSLKKFFGFANAQEKTTQFIIGGVQILVSLIVPFIIFGAVGLLAGTSYHYYVRHAEIMSANKPHKSSHKASGDEHD
jgi:hypothetical protein